MAIGTDLLYALSPRLVALSVTSGEKHQWKTVRLLAMGSVPASVLTALLLSQLFTDASEYEGILTRSLGVMLVLTAAVILFGDDCSHKTGLLSRAALAATLATGIRLLF